MDFKLPIATLAMGWLLSELSHRFRSRSAIKVAVGRALTELVEVLHYSRCVEWVLAEMDLRMEVPAAIRPELIGILTGFIPSDAELPKRYAEAVTGIAGSHPMLAFRLRSKDQVPVFIAKWRSELASKHVDGNWGSEAEKLLSESAIDDLGEACLELAWSHGVFTWWKVRKFVARSTAPPAEYKAFLDRHIPVTVA